ncbi:hypothetical protein H0A36_26200 [Endozoicomonas sp. SM1973]|uniref:Uncharacterized protein n=1 Tax=Spartinivicinus marinus TaxID=2994442 RepID=A0A853IHK5_9GAMM|nr:hypothetical protein [Spartinivicinus marinus]MCX4030498.1 hypothetical protein [Spartinivicinus marinus]NYZ69514.1 hypothetical protein [Spartinivicinus marinus]
MSESNYPDKGSFNRAFSMALTAYAADYDVAVYSGPDVQDCSQLHALMFLTK